ncbi:class I adenylate-forming enzyme family protein [Streptomyces hygroscopicus]|uniref:class I adenylate-forming enzyme family protein n=1 Tax=Streptomyces hygroscopicus TaxID=1912 RepID=UPI001FD59932|nr:AMP-binding protein [Streptomyces hygroscopicus]
MPLKAPVVPCPVETGGKGPPPDATEAISMEPAPQAAARSLIDARDPQAGPRWETISELVKDAASLYGDKQFLRCGDKTLTFSETDTRTDQLAQALIAQGVEPGDRVAIMMDNVADWPLSWFAAIKAGAITVPVNIRFGATDLAHVLKDSQAVLVLASPSCVRLASDVSSRIGHVCTVRTVRELEAGFGDLPVVGPDLAAHTDDTVNFQYTSGTTGFPKACMLSHDYWLRTAWMIAVHSGLRPDDVVLTAQSFSYMDPQWKAVMCLMGGVPLVVLPRFSASGFWHSVRQHQATLTYVLGSMPMLLYKQPPHSGDHDHVMRLVLCSGIPRDFHHAFEDRWGAAWREVYGSTESGLDLIMPPGEGAAVGSGAMGYPPAGKEVIVADEQQRPVQPGHIGEILVRGRPMMKGYWNNPDSTERALRGGWYHTGDLGRSVATGSVVHAGRLKDMIRRGGENIASAEVESVLEAHPAVLAAALVGIPDELFGELPKAFLRLRPGYRPTRATARSVLAHTRRHLAKFKVPAYVEFVDSFPMTPSARIQKRQLLRPGDDQRTGAFDAAADVWV